MKSINQKINNVNFSDIEKLLKKDTAILVNETSVYKEYAVLKNDSLTLDGHFDLIQIPNFRIYAGELLKSIRFKLNLTQKEFSKKHKISKSALMHWEHNRSAISLITLIKIAEDKQFKDLDCYIKFFSKNYKVQKCLNC